MPNTNTIKYVLVAIGSFLLGWLFFKSKKRPIVSDENFNKTISKQNDGKYYLVFNSVVILSKQVSKDQFDNFNKQYPTGAPKNVLPDFNPNINKYTIEDGQYYEYVWDGKEYGQKMPITKDEYEFRTKGAVLTVPQNII